MWTLGRRGAVHRRRRARSRKSEATIQEAAMAASCLAALGGDGYEEATQALRATAESV
jgi:hypothetical protein